MTINMVFNSQIFLPLRHLICTFWLRRKFFDGFFIAHFYFRFVTSARCNKRGMSVKILTC